MMHLPAVLTAAAEVQAFCQGNGWKFCFIGGIAVQRWGNPRFTQDVDLTLLTGFGGEEDFVDTLLTRFLTRRADARDFALQRRVLLIRTGNGIDVDVALGAFPFEARSTLRASVWSWCEGQALLTCAAEDLVIHKVFAGRDRDWGDVESVLIRQHGKLDLKLIHSELPPLLDLKGETESLAKLERLLAMVDRRLRARE